VASVNSLIPVELESSLENLLQRESAQLDQFIRLLEEELDALAVGHPDQIRECAARKQAILAQIFATRDSVNHVVRRAAANPQLKTAEAWLARSTSPRVRRAFNQLTDRADQARQLNQLASRLIQLKLQRINQRLDVLQPDGRLGAIYYPEGYAAGQMSSKGMIGRA
jgi:flagellar biosynthesis/type III secretory pathway chaperone